MNFCDAATYAASPCDKPSPASLTPRHPDKPNPSFACRQSIPRPTSASPSDYPHRHDARPADKPSLPETAHHLVRLTDPYPTIPRRRLISRHASPLLARPSDMPRSSRAGANPTRLSLSAPRSGRADIPRRSSTLQADSPTQAETSRHANPRHPGPTHASPGRHVTPAAGQPRPTSRALPPGNPTRHASPAHERPDPTHADSPTRASHRPDLADQPFQPRTAHALPTSQPHPDQPATTTRSLAHPWTTHTRSRRHAFAVPSRPRHTSPRTVGGAHRD